MYCLLVGYKKLYIVIKIWEKVYCYYLRRKYTAPAIIISIIMMAPIIRPVFPPAAVVVVSVVVVVGAGAEVVVVVVSVVVVVVVGGKTSVMRVLNQVIMLVTKVGPSSVTL